MDNDLLLDKELLKEIEIPLAKPSGIVYNQHALDVVSEGDIIFAQNSFVFEKYFKLIGKDLKIRLIIVCRYHDNGKIVSKIWQIACQKDYDEFRKWRSNNGGGTFEIYSRSNDTGYNIRNAGVRHEFHSLRDLEDRNLPLSCKVAIAAHHGKLGERYKDRWFNEGFGDYWLYFKDESLKIKSLHDISMAFYENAGVRGLLRLADHRASAKEAGQYVPDFKQFDYKFPYKTKNETQKLISEHWKDDLLLFRGPTGSGKTDGALLWAKNIIDNKISDRLIFAMPTRFTSNSVAINTIKNLSKTGLYHCSAWNVKYEGDVVSGRINKKIAEKEHEFAKILQTPVTVCTIDHLLMALTLTKEEHHLILFNLANSCLVIDEADFYDNFTQANILVLLKILKNWNIPILLMSASLPDSILPIYQKLGYNVKEIIENKTDNKRNRVNIKKIQKYSKISDTEKILNKCIKKGNGIIFANTVNKAISFYNWFRNRNIKPILYHSRFSEPDKIKIEKKLIDALGEDAWKNNCAKGIVIVTQIGEMSVNISADIIVSDLCPIDRLIQRIGRLCRFDKSKLGDLYILIPFKDGNEYPAPYGYYNMSAKKWISNDKYSKTLTSLHPKIYNNDDLLNILNKIYSNYTILQKSKDNANMLIKYFKTNWIINPMQSTDDDDVDVNYWKSRNITPQDAVYITEPKNDRFINYSEFFSWKLNNQVMTYDYLIEKGLKNNQIKTKDIYINNILNTIYITNIYDNDKGLILDYDEFN